METPLLTAAHDLYPPTLVVMLEVGLRRNSAMHTSPQSPATGAGMNDGGDGRPLIDIVSSGPLTLFFNPAFTIFLT